MAQHPLDANGEIEDGGAMRTSPAKAQSSHSAAEGVPEAVEVERETTTTSYPPLSQTSTRALGDAGSTTHSTERLISLPPADGGRRAWTFLAAAFTFETVIWGLPGAYGVFLDYYTAAGVGKSGSKTGASLLPVVGTLSAGMMYMLGPPAAILLNPRPHLRPAAIKLGIALLIVALVASSFATAPWHLLVTQGILYSVGGALAYYPLYSLTSEWFVKKRGFAQGIIFAGTGLGGAIYPFLLEATLRHYGSSATLQGLGVGTFLILGGLTPFLKPRLPLGTVRTFTERREPRPAERAGRSPWKSVRLYLVLLANLGQACAWFLPALYLPTYANSLRLSGSEGSAVLAAVNASGTLSRLGTGYLSDKDFISLHALAAIQLGASSFAILVVWGVASTSLAPLLAFAVLFGSVAGGWTSLWSRAIQEFARDDILLNNHLYGVFNFTRGVGSLITAPISSFLLAQQRPFPHASAATAYGGRFGALVLFCGLSMATAAIIELSMSLSARRT